MDTNEDMTKTADIIQSTWNDLKENNRDYDQLVLVVTIISVNSIVNLVLSHSLIPERSQ